MMSTTSNSALWLLAQAAEPVTKASWVVPYALVILLVGLAMFVICRPSRREQKVKKDS